MYFHWCHAPMRHTADEVRSWVQSALQFLEGSPFTSIIDRQGDTKGVRPEWYLLNDSVADARYQTAASSDTVGLLPHHLSPEERS
ncbi:hypothetical protein COMA1_150001 [Candidatus Nitrospira nitrosa]|uniref:Uncharacterized protein n=1 Tax=Candidatus Nitrospira nitrosa TaxID=1742972 RepID=A0A0S4LFT3_9BACT|nr:hypothetical protein COMA1_150001 [Candidatus Nitrospira nitrosa]